MEDKIGYTLWLDAINNIPRWELLTIISFLGAIYFIWVTTILLKIHRERIFHAFENIKLRQKDIATALENTIYIEITIPKNSQATAFQVQQKILKALHSIYTDPIRGAHEFSKNRYFFQKLYRRWKVNRTQQAVFSLQIWAQYPYISFRMNIPEQHFNRIEKAIFNAYANAEITIIDRSAAVQEIAKFHKSYLSYGQSTIEGKFFHRLKTFKDVSSDPVDSVISIMESLHKGRFMVYNIVISPTSHFFNQIIHYILEEYEGLHDVTIKQKSSRKEQNPSDLTTSVTTAILEKMKATLFQVIVSYWTIAPSQEEAEAKLENIQAVLNEINQKNMNTLKHEKLFTKPVEIVASDGTLQNIVETKPILKGKRTWRRPFKRYTNYGQVVSDAELYSFWHLPNITSETVSSLKLARFKKLPTSQQIREFPEKLFIDLGRSNFRMQEDTPLGVPTWEDMKKHVYILGGTGAGKSETLKTILNNLLQKEGSEQTACLIVDPKNDFATDLLTMIPEHRQDDVVYFNPSQQKERPLSFPFFSQFSGDKPNDERIEFLISIMKRFVQIDSAYSWGPELENILRQLFATAYLLPEQSLSGIDQLLHEPTQIKNILKYLPNRMQKFWVDSILKRTNNDLARYLATTNNKIGKILDYPEFMNIVDRLDTKITFEEMIQTGKIFIANLGSSSEQMKKYYSVYLTAHIAEAIFGQAKLSPEERKPAVFVVDEFQRVASDIFETLFSEVRAFNTALVISNQFMGQLEDRIQKSIESNIATKIFMRTQSVSDAAIAETILGGKVTAEDIINLPVGVAYMKTLVSGTPQEAMSITVTKTKHPTDIAKEVERFYISKTMERYGTPLEVIKQKRAITNSIYYSADREQVFFERMGRQPVFEATPEPVPVAYEPKEMVVAKSVPIDASIKTIFDF